jgi:hypothetical protein
MEFSSSVPCGLAGRPLVFDDSRASVCAIFKDGAGGRGIAEVGSIGVVEDVGRAGRRSVVKVVAPWL